MNSVNAHIPRHAVSIAREILEGSPLLVVQGARQVGKSTLVGQAVDSQRAHMVTLDDPLERAFAEADPAAFLQQAQGKTLVVDEAQRVPALALELKRTIDADRRPGRFAITGSSDLLRTPGVSDSLAGRAEFLRVYPLTPGEIMERPEPEDWVSWILDGAAGANAGKVTYCGGDELRVMVLAGGYPLPVQREGERRKARWFDSYVTSLIEHDAPQLAGGQFPSQLRALLRHVAEQGQSELVKAKTARALGVGETALGDYLALAERMYLLDVTPGWGVGFTNRVVKRPKVAVADSGLAAFLSGLTLEKTRVAGGAELFGATLKSFVGEQLRAQSTWSRERFSLHHYRERDRKIDVVVELADSRLILIEVKAAETVTERAWKNLDVGSAPFKDRAAARVVLYAGTRAVTMKNGGVPLHVLPVSSLWQHP